ncbi:MAG TPA: hypothetical protein DCX07_13325 [Phycisphaerales bacterium]|nr:hypothetical protein [Phycisphaerales bacterium]
MSERCCEELFEAMVESVGVKMFAARMDLSTRQIHRMLNGVQPNPIARMSEALSACEGLTADAAMDYLCKRRGGYFLQFPDNLADANVNAVKEAAEAIVAISEGRSVNITIREIREAISALAALEGMLGRTGKA